MMEGFLSNLGSIVMLASEISKKHKNSFEKWSFGEIKKLWIDCENNLCIQYQSGDWFHYNEKGEWW